VSTEEFFEEATRRDMRVIAGLSGIDRFGPDDFLITPDDFYRENQAAHRALPPQGSEPLCRERCIISGLHTRESEV